MNDWLPASLPSLEFILPALAWVSLIGSVIAAAVWLLQLGTRKYFSARFFYAIWMLVALRFLLVSTPASPTSLLNLFQRPANPGVELKVPAAEFNEFERLVPLTVSKSTATDVALPARVEEKTVPGISHLKSLFLVWAIGFVLLFIRLIGQCRASFLLVNRSVADDSERLHRILAEAYSLFPGCRRTKTRISNTVSSPAVAGLFRPVILLPDWSLRELTDEQLKMVVAHELIHIKRHDIAIQLATQFIVMLHWFNPLVWMIRNQIDGWREMTCDQRLLQLLKAERDVLLVKRYGETILQIAARFTSPSNLRQAQPGWMPGFIGRRKNLTVERIQMINRTSHRSILAGISAIAILLLVLTTGFTSAQILPAPNLPASDVQLLPSGRETNGAVDQEIVAGDQRAIDRQAQLPPNSVAVKVQIYEGETDAVAECLAEINFTDQEAQHGFKKLDGNNVETISNALTRKCRTITAGTICSGLMGLEMEYGLGKAWAPGPGILQGDPSDPLVIGMSLKMTPGKHGDHLTVEMIFDESHPSRLMSSNGGSLGMSTHRLNSGMAVSEAPYSSYLFSYSMVKEDSKDLQDKKATVLILTPMKPPVADDGSSVSVLQQDNWAALSAGGQNQTNDTREYLNKKIANRRPAQKFQPAKQVSYDVTRFVAPKSVAKSILAGQKSLANETCISLPWACGFTMPRSVTLGDQSAEVLEQLNELVASSKIRRVMDKSPMNQHGDYLKTSVKPFEREGELVCFIDVAVANSTSDNGTVIGTSDNGTVIGTDANGNVIRSQPISQAQVQTTLLTQLGSSMLLCFEMPQNQRKPGDEVVILLLTPSKGQSSE